jgi:hypothetical protein
MTPSTYSLVSLQYYEEQKAIVAGFASAKKKITKKYSFFPSFFLPREEKNLFEKLLKNGEWEKHQRILRTNSLQITAAAWGGLKKIATQLYRLTGYFPNLIEPERQFLLLQKWKYFQSFDENFNALSNTFQNTLFPDFCEPLHETLSSLNEHSAVLTKKMNERIGISHELCIPLTKTCFTEEEQLEILLDNFMFQQSQPLPKERAEKVSLSHLSFGQRKKLFENIWNYPLLGEGKCSCCSPASPIERNVHSASLVLATALQDGVYFETNNPNISKEYHQQNKNKRKREERKKEFGLLQYPIGPLYRGEKIFIPLQEALLERENRIISIGLKKKKAVWNCNTEPFILQKLNQYFQQQLHAHSARHHELIQPYLSEYRLAYTVHTQKNPMIQLHNTARQTVSKWHSRMGLYLLQGNTKWRDPVLSGLAVTAP